MTRSLEGRLAVVTGAGRGIGRAIAERFAAEGARVACLDVKQGRPAEPPRDGAVCRYEVDVADRASVRLLFDRIASDAGAPIGILVNNAAWVRYQPLDDIDEATLDRMLAVGVKALVWTLQAAMPQLAQSGHGAVINLCSSAAVRATADSLAYCAVKGAVDAMTRAAAIDCGARGVRVNAIAPGLVPTPGALARMPPAAIEQRLRSTPLGRLAQAGDIAAVAAFLASDDSAFINGETLLVDGGRSNAAL